MKFIRQKDGSLNILVSDEDDYDVTDDNGVDVVLSQEQVRELKGVLCASHSNASERGKVLDEKLASRYKEILLRCKDTIEDTRHNCEIIPKTCDGWCSAYDLCKELRTPAPEQP